MHYITPYFTQVYIVERITSRPVTDGSSDGSPVLVIVVPVSAAGTLLVFSISVVLIVLLKRTCRLPSISKC